jgi:guanylate kinase
MPKIFMLDGPAGSGRSTITPIILEHFGKRLKHFLRVTTRPRREDDTTYHYIDQIAFGRYLAKNEFAGHRTFGPGQSYGVRKTPIEEAVERGFPVYSLMDLGTFNMVRNCWPDCVIILLISPLDVLRERLESKGLLSELDIQERLDNAALAFSKAAHYDYVIPNRQGQLDKVTKHVISIMEAEIAAE